MLRRVKLSGLALARALGAFRAVERSGWRGQRLLILCYHGIAIDDEHEWSPGLFMSADRFAERLALLRAHDCHVLPLADALRHLREGTLPPRSVALTFDDGNHDFLARAWPLLQVQRMPATVYLTTYYSEKGLPVFPLMLSYLLWKRRGAVHPAIDWLGGGPLDLRTAESRQEVKHHLMRHAHDRSLSAEDRDALAAALASALDVDYAEIRRRRILHLLSGEEVRALAAAGVDFQLHSHRHRAPFERALYHREVEENRERITALTGATPTHFCYPNGFCLPHFPAWLAEVGVATATTCEPALASRDSAPLQLPRVLDHSEMSALEFEAWLTGTRALLPQRRRAGTAAAAAAAG